LNRSNPSTTNTTNIPIVHRAIGDLII
jgi:hypothetical protein